LKKGRTRRKPPETILAGKEKNEHSIVEGDEKSRIDTGGTMIGLLRLTSVHGYLTANCAGGRPSSLTRPELSRPEDSRQRGTSWVRQQRNEGSGFYKNPERGAERIPLTTGQGSTIETYGSGKNWVKMTVSRKTSLRRWNQDQGRK